MWWDSLDDVFQTVTDLAIAVAPVALPAAAAFGATKLLGGTTKEAWLSAGAAGVTSGLLGQMRGASSSSAPGADASSGVLGRAGIASGGISGAGTPGVKTAGATTPVLADSAVKPAGGILDRLGIEGSDLLKFGGNIIASLDDTDDEFRKRQLDIAEKRNTVAPVTWTPGMPSVHPRSDPNDITNRRVI